MTESYGDYVPLQSEVQPDEDRKDDDVLIPSTLICVIVAFFCGFLYIMPFYVPIDPKFSVRLTGVGGLDDLRRPAISPFFNLTIHVDNGWSRQPACRPNSVVIMYYGHDRSIAWGEVPAFCVDERSEIDLDVSLSSKGAILSRALRDKMALLDRRELLLQLSVDIKPIHPEHPTPSHVSSCVMK